MRHFTKASIPMIAVLVAALTGCGMEEDKHDGTPPAGNNPPAGNTTPSTNVDPLYSPAARTIALSQKYVGGAAEAEIRGNLPGMTWSQGTIIGAPANGYFSGQALAATVTGTFDLSYVAGSTWANYGTEENLKAMSADGRAFVSCNWWDGTKKVTPSGSGECHLKITVASDGKVTGAGNMRSFQ